MTWAFPADETMSRARTSSLSWFEQFACLRICWPPAKHPAARRKKPKQAAPRLR